MAVKKKAKKAAVQKKPVKKASSRGRSKPRSAEPQPIVGLPAQAKGPSLVPLVVIAALAVALYFAFRSTEIPPAHKVAAGAQLESPAPSPTVAPMPTPQKRSTSPAGPRVWDRSKSKAPARFYIVREKDGLAEVHIFKSGNQAVRVLSSEKGGRKTVELQWDGKDNKGQVVAPGTYYARISGAHGDSIEEILIK